MPFPPPKNDFIHDAALGVMQSVLSNDDLRRALIITAKDEGVKFGEWLAIWSYDLAEYLVAEGDARA